MYLTSGDWAAFLTTVLGKLHELFSALLRRYPAEILHTAVRKGSAPNHNLEKRVRSMAGELMKFLVSKDVLNNSRQIDLRGNIPDFVRRSHPFIGEVVFFIISVIQ